MTTTQEEETQAGGGNTNPTQVSKARRQKVEIFEQIIDLIQARSHTFVSFQRVSESDRLVLVPSSAQRQEKKHELRLSANIIMTITICPKAKLFPNSPHIQNQSVINQSNSKKRSEIIYSKDLITFNSFKENFPITQIYRDNSLKIEPSLLIYNNRHFFFPVSALY